MKSSFSAKKLIGVMLVSFMMLVGAGVQVAHAAPVVEDPKTCGCQGTPSGATVTSCTLDSIPAGMTVALTQLCTNSDGSTDTGTGTGASSNLKWVHTPPAGSTAAPTTTYQVTGPAAVISKTVGAAINAAACVVTDPMACIAWFIFQLCATILGFIGLFFNYVVVLTVFQFGLYFGNSSGLLLGWSILRDIGNIVLLFGFIAIGIMTILDVHQYSAQKTLPRLLIFAVLLNFSLFASEAVIDVANVLSASLYQQAGQSSNATCVSTQGSSAAGQTCTQATLAGQTPVQQVGISGAVIEASGLSTIWNLPQQGAAQITKSSGSLVLMLSALFMIIAAAVLCAGAIMLSIRALTLVFLLVLSPIGFAAMAIPQLEKIGNQWLHTLLSQAFFAPIFILLILVSLKIATTIKGIGGGGSFAAAVGNPNSSTIGIFILFSIVIGFFIGALLVANKMKVIGADFATKTAGAATFGATAFVGRRTVGLASAGAAKAIRSSNLGTAEMRRFAAGIADKGAHASFDLRTNKQFAAGAKAAKIDFGKPSGEAAHGIHKIEEKQIDDRVKYAETLHMSPEQKDLDKVLKDRKKARIKQLSEEYHIADLSGEELKKANEKIKEATKSIDDQITENNPALRYAAEIEHQKWPWPSIGTHVNHAAAEKIRGNSNKSDTDKIIDSIKKMENKAAPPPAPAPTVVVQNHVDGGGGGDHGGGGGDHGHGGH